MTICRTIESVHRRTNKIRYNKLVDFSFTSCFIRGSCWRGMVALLLKIISINKVNESSNYQKRFDTVGEFLRCFFESNERVE